MERYSTWEEYYASKQTAYLDDENGADEDINEKVGGYKLNGLTWLGHFSVYDNDYQLFGIFTGATLSELKEYLAEYILLANLGLDPDLDNDDLRDYLTINYGTDDKLYVWYYDGKTNVCCDTETLDIFAGEDCDRIFGVEEA